MIVSGTTTSAIGIARRGARSARTVERRTLPSTGARRGFRAVRRTRSTFIVASRANESVLRLARASAPDRVRCMRDDRSRSGSASTLCVGGRRANVFALVASHAGQRVVHRDAGARAQRRGAPRASRVRLRGPGRRLGRRSIEKRGEPAGTRSSRPRRQGRAPRHARARSTRTRRARDDEPLALVIAVMIDPEAELSPSPARSPARPAALRDARACPCSGACPGRRPPRRCGRRSEAAREGAVALPGRRAWRR